MYSSATISVRSTGKIATVLLFGISKNCPLAVNSCEDGKWKGWDQYVTKDDLDKNGVQIGGLLKVYRGESSDTQTKDTLTTSDIHMCGFLIIDQNNYTDVYVIGRESGVTTLCNTSGGNTPVISKNNSGSILEITLKPWAYYVFLSFSPCNILKA